MTYAEKLKDPRWQKKRLEILERDSFMCKNCGRDDKTLHVDHKIYRKGFDPWEYDETDLQTLCEDCHKAIGAYRQRLTEYIGSMNTFELEQLERFIQHSPIAGVSLIVNDLDMILIQTRSLNRILKIVEQYKAGHKGYSERMVCLNEDLDEYLSCCDESEKLRVYGYIEAVLRERTPVPEPVAFYINILKEAKPDSGCDLVLRRVPDVMMGMADYYCLTGKKRHDFIYGPSGTINIKEFLETALDDQ